MHGSDEHGPDDGVQDAETDEVSASGPADGPENSPTGPGYAAHGAGPEEEESDEVADAEILDAADVSAAVDEVFADDDPLALALNQRDEYLDALRRLQADFENYKKRVANQQAEQMARAAAALVDKLLPVLDTLDLAAQHLGDADSSDAKALVAAASLLQGVLGKEGLERIDPLGEQFDPNTHEAVGHVPAADVSEGDEGGDADREAPGSDEPVVAQVMRPGYRWKGTVVRPAMVMVRG
jgi:molecular chaperone GrpE